MECGIYVRVLLSTTTLYCADHKSKIRICNFIACNTHDVTLETITTEVLKWNEELNDDWCGKITFL